MPHETPTQPREATDEKCSKGRHIAGACDDLCRAEEPEASFEEALQGHLVEKWRADEIRAAHARELAAARAETWNAAIGMLVHFWPKTEHDMMQLRKAFEQRAAAAEKEE